MKTLYNIYSLIERLENRDGFLLNEITIKDKWQKESNKWSGKLDAETFEYLCSLDPTTNPNKVGRYANWILAKYNPNADFDTLKVCLEWYADGIKRGIINRLGISNDINAYKSYDEFISAMNGIMHSGDSSMSNSEYNNRQKLEGQFEILGSNSMFDIVACKTFEAERYFGSGTGWCTVANEKYFEHYMKDGQLYIIYPKNGNEELKMQFHFESKSFADKDDNVYKEPFECIKRTIQDENIQNELFELCQGIFPQYKTKFMSFKEAVNFVKQQLANGEDPQKLFNRIRVSKSGFTQVELNNQWNLINQEGQLISEYWYDAISDVFNGFAVVSLYFKYNFINTEGQILCDQWFDDADSFYDGFARVRKESKYNIINTEGQILCDQWFDYVGYFKGSFAWVQLKGQYNIINQEGQILCDQWFDNFDYFDNGLLKIELNRKYNVMDTDGHILCDQWFTMVYEFVDGYAIVRDGVEWNFINKEGRLLSDRWFDYVEAFNEGFAVVKLQGKENYINTEGELLCDQWFDYATKFENGLATVILHDVFYKINTNGQVQNMSENKQYSNNFTNMGRRIKLNEKYLRRMIKESLNEYFSSNDL